MSQHVEKLKIGDEIDVRGPNGQMKYEPNMYKHIGMIAGGSGITPMVQVCFRNPFTREFRFADGIAS